MNVESNRKKGNNDGGKLLSIRYIQILLLSCLAGIYYGKNVNFSVAIVAMTSEKNTDSNARVYKWTDSDKILSSFYWLVLPSQLIAGYLAEKYSSKLLLIITTFFSSIFTIAVPFMAENGSWAVMICRAIQGSMQAAFFPAAFNLIAKWAPVPERIRMCNLIFIGMIIGTIASMLITGWICGSSIGWPLAFYLSGTVGAVWLFLWIVFGSNSPQDHRTITETEKLYILSTQGEFVPVKPDCTPWLDILKSLPVWAIFICNCSYNWGFFMLLTQIPIYLNKVFHVNISASGLLSALPFIANLVLNVAFVFLFEALGNRKILTTTNARKIATSVGVLGPAAALLVLAFLGEKLDVTAVILLLVIAVGTNAGTNSGFLMNNTDIAPNYAATINALTFGFAVLFSIIGPIVVDMVVTDPDNVDQWGTIFYITSTLYIASGIFYLLFGSAEIQPWNSKGIKNKKPTV